MPLMTVEAMKMETTLFLRLMVRLIRSMSKKEQVNQEDLLISFEIDE